MVAGIKLKYHTQWALIQHTLTCVLVKQDIHGGHLEAILVVFAGKVILITQCQTHVIILVELLSFHLVLNKQQILTL